MTDDRESWEKFYNFVVIQYSYLWVVFTGGD